MAEAMIMTVDQFRSKLAKSSNQAVKKKKDDSAETKKELKKLQQQVKEIKEAQVARREKSDSDATETDNSGWGFDEDANRSDLCEMVRPPKEAFQLTTPVDIPLERQRKLKDVTSRGQSKKMEHRTSSLASRTLTRATATTMGD